jgi:cytochrome b561
MNVGELTSTVDHLLHMVLYVITGGIAIGGLITLISFYSHNIRRAVQQRAKKKTSASAPLTEDGQPLAQ